MSNLKQIEVTVNKKIFGSDEFEELINITENNKKIKCLPVIITKKTGKKIKTMFYTITCNNDIVINDSCDIEKFYNINVKDYPKKNLIPEKDIQKIELRDSNNKGIVIKLIQ